MRRISAILICFLLALTAQVSWAVTISTNTTIAATDTSLDGQDVVVDGATLTIDGAHEMTTLTLVNGAKVTHSLGESNGMSITAGAIDVESGSSIDVSGLGLQGDAANGQSGGSYGGRGGGNAADPAYGDFHAPAELGTGGHCYSANDRRYGGGIIKLVAASLTLDGTLRADGSGPQYRCAGASGGAVWLDVGVLSGTGTVSANGQNGNSGSSFGSPGGGGGGRVAVYYDTLAGFDPFTQVSVSGGAGNGGSGQSGSIYIKQGGAVQHTLVTSSIGSDDALATVESLLTGVLEGAHYLIKIGAGSIEAASDNWTLTSLTWELPHSIDVGDFTLAGTAVVDHPRGDTTGVSITAADVLIESGASINVSGLGLQGDAANGQSGGSYGGRGGGNAADPAYGDFHAPAELGTGGHCYSANDRRYGGGIIKLVADSLTLDGTLRADGSGPQYRCAGASGGAVWLDVGVLSGTGTVSANGQNGNSGSSFGSPGGGGGGRVAVYYDTLAGFDPFTQVSVSGGAGNGGSGQSGSIMVKAQSDDQKMLVTSSISSDDAEATIDELLTGSLKDDDYLIKLGSGSLQATADVWTLTGVVWELDQPVIVDSLALMSSVIKHARGDVDGVSITAQTLSVDAGSSVNVSELGLPGNAAFGQSGGSYGGRGGGNSAPAYGDYAMPVDLGTGGHCYAANDRRYGGGRLKIQAQTMDLQGSLLANGSGPLYRCAGSSGGTILVDVDLLSGSGVMQANGLAGSSGSNWTGPGGGGGGRIAVYYGGLDGFDTETQIQALAGSGFGTPAEPGTIYLVDGQSPTRVISSFPEDGELVAEAVTSIRLSFKNKIDPSSIDSSDAVLMGTSGPIPLVSVVKLTDYEYEFVTANGLVDDVYQFAAGPDIRVPAGYQMDQDGDGLDGESLDDTYTISFTVDSSPPTQPTVTSHAVAPAVNNVNTTSVMIEGNRSEQSSILLNGSEVVATGTGSYSIASVSLSEGANQIELVARDAAGNEAQPVVVLFQVDSVAPVMANISPSGYLQAAPQSVVVSVTETGSGLDASASSLSLTRNGNNVPGNASVMGSDYVFSPSIALLQGNFQLSGTVADLAGNSVVVAHSFVVDYTPPTAPVVDAVPAVVNNASLQLSGTRESNTSIRFNGIEVVSSGSSATWSVQVTLQAGDNVLAVTAVDLAGNESTATTVNVRFDNTAPGPVTLSSPVLEGDGLTVTVRWPTYNELANGNDIASYQIYRESGAFTDVGGLPPLGSVTAGVFEFTVADHARGTPLHYAVVAVDAQGLAETAVTSVAYTPIDVEAPHDISSLGVTVGATELSLAWTPSADTAGDLAGYRVYVTDGGNASSTDLAVATVGSANPVVYSVGTLAPATAYPIKVVAFDGDGNESTGLANPGVTLIANPTNLQVAAYSGRVDLSWDASVNTSLVQNYRLYAETTDYISVSGLTPRRSVDASTLASGIAALADGTTYYFAVTAVNLSGGEDPVVQTVSATPQADDEGPEVQSASWVEGATPVALEGATLSADGYVTLTAADQAELGRAELLVDGTLVKTDLTGSNGYELPLHVFDFADGAHALTLVVYDTLDNSTSVDYSVAVALGAPSAPAIASPATDFTTNESALQVSGSSPENTEVTVYVNGSQAATGLPLSVAKQFASTVALTEGVNTIEAESYYPGRGAVSARSAARVITLDTTIPDAPTNATASPKELGQMTVRWQSVDGSSDAADVLGFNLYRSTSSFSAASDVGVTKVNGQIITNTTYVDLPIPDGTYFYAVTAVNQVGTESPRSNVVSATADSEPPTATIEYTPYGAFDEISGRMSYGVVDVRATFSEPLRNAPYFALVPDGGVPATISLTKTSQGTPDMPVYFGQYEILPTTPSGIAYAVLSAHDAVGNRGTEVIAGSYIEIDTHGPELATLVLNPADPINNDPDEFGEGRTVEVYLTLNDELATGETPLLIPLAEGEDIPPYDLVAGVGITLAQDHQQSADGAPFYVGAFDLPISAGQDDLGEPNVENLTFVWQGVDDLGNTTNKILDRSQFQVYQGSLPPLAVPFGLEGSALAAGQVQLAWEKVEGAAAYRLYRKAPGEADFTLLIEVSDAEPASYLDGESVALADGAYAYTITSVREENGQQGESVQSEAVTVSADATAPGVPTTLALSLQPYGISATWTAPTTDALGNAESGTLTYRLYRSALPEGSQGSFDIEGLSPIAANLTNNTAVDQSPSETDHMYAVTAVDEAGNESAPSTGEYLNFGLLPVSNLKVELADGGLPVLSWSHSGVGISGFDVYRVAGSATQLNGALYAPETFEDATYNGGNAVSGAPVARTYRVIAVDASDVESIAHDITLPALSASLPAGQQLNRGVMNVLQFRVDNLGGAAATGVTLQVVTDDDGVARTHTSSSFDVPAGGFADVPVVIGGYPGLADLAPVTLTLKQAPNPGDEVLIHQADEVVVADSAIIATLITEDFTRGATGDARIRIENTSDVEIEIVTAKQSGQQPSDEVRLRLLDEDENVLSVASLNQVVASNIVTLAGGTSVARISAGTIWESQPTTVSVPSAAPDDVELELEIDAFYYQLGKATQVSMPGTGATRALQLAETEYYGQLDSVTPTAIFGDEKVTIRGRAIDRDSGDALPFAPLVTVLSVDGWEKAYPAYPDKNGEFVFQYSPNGRTGTYTVSILHPSIHDRPNHGQFTVSGAGVSPKTITAQIPRNFDQKINFAVTSGAATTLTNTRIEFASDASGQTLLPTGLSVLPSNPVSLMAKQSGVVGVTLSGDNSADASGQLRFNIRADEVSGVVETVTLNYTLVDVGPAMFPTPTLVESGLARDDTVLETVTFKNRGLDTLQNGQLTLVDPGGSALPTWVQLVTLPSLGSVGIGEEVEVQLSFSPDSTVAEANYLFELRVTGDNMDQIAVPVFVAVTQSGVGSAFFHASDIYTATLDSEGVPIAGLVGAKVKLQNESVLSEVYEGTTDANGEFTFGDIPAGTYTYRASAFDHQSVAGRVRVKPGVTVAEDVFLFNQLVSVSFSVKEVSLEDRYEIELNAMFETNVPVAVVQLEPTQVLLPAMRQGEVFYGELQLTNYGLIRAYDVKATLPESNSLARFELLASVPEELEAGESLALPYRVVALGDFDPGLTGDSTGGGCSVMTLPMLLTSSCVCTNGQVVEGSTFSEIKYIPPSCGFSDLTYSVPDGVESTIEVSVPKLSIPLVSPLQSVTGGASPQCSDEGAANLSNDDIDIYGSEGRTCK